MKQTKQQKPRIDIDKRNKDWVNWFKNEVDSGRICIEHIEMSSQPIVYTDINGFQNYIQQNKTTITIKNI